MCVWADFGGHACSPFFTAATSPLHQAATKGRQNALPTHAYTYPPVPFPNQPPSPALLPRAFSLSPPPAPTYSLSVFIPPIVTFGGQGQAGSLGGQRHENDR